MQDRKQDQLRKLWAVSATLENVGFGVPAAKELLEEKRKTFAGRLLPKAVPRAAPVARAPTELRRPPGEEPAGSRGPAAAHAAPPTWHSYTPRSQLPADSRWRWSPEDVCSSPAEDGPVPVRCSQCSRPLPEHAALSPARGRTAIGASRAPELSVCERCAESTSRGGPRDREAGRYYDGQGARSASRSRSPRGPAEPLVVVLEEDSSDSS